MKLCSIYIKTQQIMHCGQDIGNVHLSVVGIGKTRHYSGPVGPVLV
jgi:hypothetical protein